MLFSGMINIQLEIGVILCTLNCFTEIVQSAVVACSTILSHIEINTDLPVVHWLAGIIIGQFWTSVYIDLVWKLILSLFICIHVLGKNATKRMLCMCDNVQVKILCSWLPTLHWWATWTGWCYSRALMLTSCLYWRSRTHLVMVFRHFLPSYSWLAAANKQTTLSTGKYSC